MTPKPDDRSTLVDSRVADAWREASSEEPSASVDNAVLAAARREVSARPETLAVWEAREARASRRRWWPLAAAATVAAIAVGVLQLTPTDKLATPASETATVSDVPAAAMKSRSEAAAPAPADTAPAMPPPASPSAAAPGASTAVSTDTAQPTAPPATTSTPTPFPAAKPVPQRAPSPTQSKQEKAVQRADERPKGNAENAEPSTRQAPAVPSSPAARGIAPVLPVPPAEPYASAPPARAAAAPEAPVAKMAAQASANRENSARARERAPLPVTDWIALIRRLRAEGKTPEAAKELAAFRTAHADHEKLLPPDLRDWRPPEK